MSRFKYLKNISFNELSAERIINAFKVRVKDLPHLIEWRLNGRKAKTNKDKIRSFHNIHKGRRCFIVANGPSLKQTDLSLLKDEITIGMNRIYLSSAQNGFIPTYIVVHDIPVQLMQFTKDFDDLKLPKFFNWNARKHFTLKENITFIRSDYTPKFSEDLTKTSWGGHSVTNICIQLAYYMGFNEVYLVGKDHNYEQKGVPGKLVQSTGDESNHFTKGYYKKGMGWRIPDYKGEELAYAMAREAFEKAGRIIKDATIHGKLQVFDKVDYYTLFKNNI
ncbi:6-hydroxymethylpterin diphosphokinase MptE-like protein [Parafilimonas sp.]|uniref:6-hydroxymethylpterin diphosphokinase MptE-like protein n=1 Tax=Parafilimonas sp. TaxID=1969739 RepID=UPI0039E2883E